MKLRIRGDSLRLRLTRAEVERLRATGRVEESMHVGPSRLTYALETDPDGDQVTAIMEGAAVSVRVPAGLALEWIDTEQVGFEAEQAHGDRSLSILVEKDFKCLVPRGDGSDEDTFPNPGDVC